MSNRVPAANPIHFAILLKFRLAHGAKIVRANVVVKQMHLQEKTRLVKTRFKDSTCWLDYNYQREHS